MKKFKIIRIILSIIVLSLTLLFFYHKNIPGSAVHFYEKAAQFIINLQILPAILSITLIYIIAIICITLITGRVICSAFCPLGIYNDLISRLGAKIRKKNFHYIKKINFLKYIILFTVIILSVLGL
ncbi:MAG TPA: 4Fe-4S binding protein, partial [Spirochaetota bacterium]|nr:4Fe-4S binding protein [Spirochaetota bacterium]